MQVSAKILAFSILFFVGVVRADICEEDVGLLDPISECTSTDPCDDLLGTYAQQDPPVTEIDEVSTEPTCATSSIGTDAGRTAYDDGSPYSMNVDGTTRYHCLYVPSTASISNKLPLVIFIHGSGGSAQTVYDLTSLRDKAVPGNSSDFSGGFLLASVQARNLHWPTATTDQEGSKWDSYYRDLSTNNDVAHIDKVINTITFSGKVDNNRIYLIGWSNGARFASFYGLHRNQTGTPLFARKIAAVANYSGGDPFENIETGVSPSCKQDPYPTSALPVKLISRSCDAMACDTTQASSLVSQGLNLNPGSNMTVWESDLDGITSGDVSWLLINGSGATATSCVAPPYCTPTGALLNHLTWPDGINGTDREPDLLNFLSAHTL